MGKKLVDGVWVIACDWVDNDNNPCNLGTFGEPRMFVDPDRGTSEDKHYQCGAHHGVVKQEDNPDFQVPEGHKLSETTLVQKDIDPGSDKAIRIEGLKPDLEGAVWDGKRNG